MTTKILFTGDCRINGKYQKGIQNLFALFPDYDLYVVNFESSIQIDSSIPLVPKSVPISASLEDVEFLLSYVDPKKLLLNFSNNHSLDVGQKNLTEAKQWLQNKRDNYYSKGNL